MRVRSVRYHRDGGWSDSLPALGDAPALILVFGDRSFLDEADPINVLSVAYPNAAVVGVSAAVAGADGALQRGGLVATVMAFDRVGIVTATERSGSDPRGLGEAIGTALAADDVAMVLVTGGPSGMNDLFAGIARRVPPRVVLAGMTPFGGDAGWVVADGKPATGMVTAVALYGRDLVAGLGCESSTSGFGPTRVVTGVEGEWLTGLDGRDAAFLYRSAVGAVVGEWEEVGAMFPVHVTPAGGSDASVRRVASVDPLRGVRVAGGLTRGDRLRFARVRHQAIAESAVTAATVAAQGDFTAETFTLVASTPARRDFLGSDGRGEIGGIESVLPEDANTVAAYVSGSCVRTSTGAIGCHTQAISVLTVAELA